jgi:hypothetical protein
VVVLVVAHVGHFAAVVSGFNFGIILFGTISFTFGTVGAKGLIFFTGFGWNRFRWALVNGVVLTRTTATSSSRGLPKFRGKRFAWPSPR